MNNLKTEIAPLTESDRIQINLRETESVPLLFNNNSISEIIPIDKSLVLFLDYDGTLSPIVNHPEDAVLSLEQLVLSLQIHRLP